MNPFATPALLLLQASPAGPAPNPLVTFLPFVVIIGIMYFMMIRPMQRQRKEQQQMLASLENGNVVLTTGGIVGTIVALTGDTVTLRVKPDNVKLLVMRSAVSGLAPEENK